MDNLLESFITILFVASLVILCIFFIYIVFVVCFSEHNGTYKYTDLDNNTGVAIDCSYYRTAPICKLEDGTIIQVKNYKRI